MFEKLMPYITGVIIIAFWPVVYLLFVYGWLGETPAMKMDRWKSEACDGQRIELHGTAEGGWFCLPKQMPQ